ncbi:MAG: MFS transporter [Candidatus Latescibacterota bacterium]
MHSPNSEPPRDPAHVPIDTNLVLIFGLTLIVVMGVSSITPVFYRMREALNLSQAQVGMLITFYSLPGVIFALPLGMYADRIGRKKLLVPFLILFGISGAACAFTRDFTLLLALRFIQGFGATAAGVLNPTILGDIYSGRARTVAMSYNIGALNIGTASFPIIGGALGMFGWQYPFLLPLSAIPLGIAIHFLFQGPEPKNTMNTGEYLRAALYSISHRKALGLFFITLMTFVVLYGSYITFFPLLLGSRFGAAPFIIGIIMSVTSFSTVLTTTRVKWFVQRFKERDLMIAGFFCYAVAMVIFPLIPALWLFIIPTFIYGFGNGINSPSAQSILVELAPEDIRAGFLSVNSMILRIGQTLGPLIMGIIIALWGMESVFYAGALFSLLMLAMTAALLK